MKLSKKEKELVNHIKKEVDKELKERVDNAIKTLYDCEGICGDYKTPIHKILSRLKDDKEEEETFYKVGDRFEIHGEEVTIMRVGANKCAFIHNRNECTFGIDAIKVVDYKKITKKEFEAMAGLNLDYLIKIND
jgi:hypothetical protein